MSAPPPPARVRVVCDREDSHAEVTHGDEERGETRRAVVRITSRSGIGRATVERVGQRWPDQVLVQLELAGLESFAVAAGEWRVEWSVSSTGQPESRVSRRHRGGEETPLDVTHPWHERVKIVADPPTIPLRRGHFEVCIPPALLASLKEPAMRLEWIDFYRQ